MMILSWLKKERGNKMNSEILSLREELNSIDQKLGEKKMACMPCGEEVFTKS